MQTAVLKKLKQKLSSLRAAESTEAGAVKTKLKLKGVDLDAPVAKLHPNTWNPNVMDKETLKKLRRGIEMVIEQTGTIPPVIVRPHPTLRGDYEIIDGYHRWMVYRDLKHFTIPARVLDVDDKTARILTDTLNYLRGQPDEEKYSEFLADLVTNQGATLEELGSLLPESEDEIQNILEVSQAGLGALSIIEENAKASEKEITLDDENTWLTLSFDVSAAMAKPIEREIDRIAATLTGKNRRGRALEYMAAMSATTPVEDFPKPPPKKPDEKKPKKKKAA